jgi:hypothetical protein
MKIIILSLFLIVISIVTLPSANAEGPRWVIFDSDYPRDFIDANSITAPEKGIVRFWERAGNRMEKNKTGEITFAQYTLCEINCILKQHREIKWDMALEDQTSGEAMEARAKFLKSTTELQNQYPTRWENIEPNKHSYARYDFVCKAQE